MIEAARVYYIFSFAFSPLPFRESVSLKGQTRSLGEFLALQLGTLNGTHYESPVACHMSEEKEPPASRSALYIPYPHLSIDTIQEYVDVEGMGRALKRCHIAVFESGMGVMWVLVEPETPPNLRGLSRAASREGLPGISPIPMNVAETVPQRTIHQVFMSEIQALCAVINQALSELPPDDHERLSRKNPPSLMNSAPETLATQSEGQRARFRVVWIDKDPAFLWHDDTGEHARQGAFEEPSVAIVLRVEEALRDRLDLDPQLPDRLEVERLISGLLHTTTETEIDLFHHAPEHRGDRLHSLYPAKRFRTFLHCNCLLVLQSEDMRSPLFNEFTTGLFRTFCALRGYWHVYSVVNEQLDSKISLLLSQFEEMVTNSEPSGADLLVKQEEIIRAKGHFLTCLATEDPLVRSIGLTPFGALYDVGSAIYRLAELKHGVQYKLGELDKLFDMVTSYQFRSRYDLRGSPFGIRRKLSLFLGAVSLLLAFLIFQGHLRWPPDPDARIGVVVLLVFLFLYSFARAFRPSKSRQKTGTKTASRN